MMIEATAPYSSSPATVRGGSLVAPRGDGSSPGARSRLHEDMRFFATAYLGGLGFFLAILL